MKRSLYCFFVTIIISAILLVIFGIIIGYLSKIGFLKEEAIPTVSISEDEIPNINTKIIKDEAPEIKLIGDSLVKVNNIEEYNELGATAEDDFDGDLSNNIEIEISKINDFNYQVRYTVQDSAGNTDTQIRDIRVIIGIVCLTFDDGPSEEITPQILDILKEKGVNATFFVNGFSEDKNYLIQRENDEGNVVALHGYSHDYSKIYTDIDTLANNFYKLEEEVSEIIGIDSKIIRFPGGTSNTISKKYCDGIMTQAIQRFTDEGYIYVDWNVDSNDAGKDENNSEAIYANVIQNLKPNRTNVVLMHDRAEKQSTVDALPNIIDYCFDNGYDIQVITSETSLKSSQHHPNN